MAKSKMLRGILVLALVFGTAVAGFSFDGKTFPDPIQKGSILISPGFGLGTFWPGIAGSSNSTLVSGTVAVDYALPINFPLTVGGEICFSGSRVKSWGAYDPDSSFLGIPLIARAAWHPNWEVKNLDTYLLVKLGYDIGFWGGDYGDIAENPHGVVFGTNIGIRYFFTSSIGAFVELGYEYHFLRWEYENHSAWGRGIWPAFGTKFLTLGVTFKAGG
jgi:hypothetical protein